MIVQSKALTLSGLGNGVAAPAASYQDAFDAAFNTCAGLLSEEDCRRMMGYVPFLCPPPTQRPIYTHPLFWLAGGLLVSKVFL